MRSLVISEKSQNELCDKILHIVALVNVLVITLCITGTAGRQVNKE